MLLFRYTSRETEKHRQHEVDMIRAHGGKVVFVRPPSDERYLEAEYRQVDVNKDS